MYHWKEGEPFIQTNSVGILLWSLDQPDQNPIAIKRTAIKGMQEQGNQELSWNKSSLKL